MNVRMELLYNGINDIDGSFPPCRIWFRTGMRYPATIENSGFVGVVPEASATRHSAEIKDDHIGVLVCSFCKDALLLHARCWLTAQIQRELAVPLFAQVLEPILRFGERYGERSVCS